MDRHTCKLCFRRFHNGRALGGHMRSHVMAAAAAAAAAYAPASPLISLASTSSTEVDDGGPARQEPVSRVVRDSSSKCFVVKVGGVAPEFSAGVGAAGGESSIVQDGQSDTESSPRFAVSRRRRSKRARRRAPAPDPEPEPASSVSDATPEEDVAMSLVMLSRDSWSRSEHEQRWAPASSDPEQNNDDDDDDNHAGVFDDGAATGAAPRHGGRFQCGACRKVFRSYQALGGHRASIKKGKGGCVPPPPTPPPSKAHRHHRAVDVHECPYCFRVFGSGQALGGHKRAHMMMTTIPSSGKCGGASSGSIIDLNVPPCATDDDFELSAVYDAEEFGTTSTRR